MGPDEDFPRYGEDIDVDKLADKLEEFASRIRGDTEPGLRVHGVTATHVLDYEEFSEFKFTLHMAATPSIEITDLPEVYKERESADE